MNKKRIVSIFMTLLIIIFVISANLNVVLADTSSTDTKTQTTSKNSDDYFDEEKGKYVYKGFENESKWDAFYEYFVHYWNEDQKELTNAELDRYKAGPTKEEEELAKEGRGPTIRPTDEGQTAVTVDQVTELIETRNASGDDDAELDNKGYDNVHKKAVDLYQEYAGYNINTEKDKRKEAGNKFLDKCDELKKLNNGRFLKDTDILQWIKEVGNELGISTDRFFSGQEGESEGNKTIYVQPTVSTNKTSGSTLDDMMTDADNFVQAGENDKIKASDLQRLSRLIYNIALQIGIGVAVIAGLALGIQFMMSSVEGKADVKKGLKIYVIGCAVVFGSFGIWKLIVTIMQQV